MKYLYGPVNSRRLGNSLGVNLTLPKTCSFNCIYCQLGKTGDLTVARSEYVKIKDIIEEFKAWLEVRSPCGDKIDYFTISGAGEPTLNTGLGDLIRQVKEISPLKIALITNASLFSDPRVRREALRADLIIPSLDASTQEVFVKVDRPLQGIRIEDIIEGLVCLRREFRGKIWIEVMLIKGINDDIRHIRRLKEALERINPDKIQINSPVRSTSEDNLSPVSGLKLKKIKVILGEKAEVI